MHLPVFLLLIPAIAIAMSSETQIIERLLYNYDKHEPPRRDSPTEVKAGMYISNIVFSGQEATVTMYLRQAWNDQRLIHENSGSERLRFYAWDKVWVPDTFFRNDLYSFVPDQTVPNKLMFVKSNGDIWYVMKLSMKLPARQSRQGEVLVPMMLESFGYTMDIIYFSALEHPVEVDREIYMPDMALLDHAISDCSQNYTAGAFPCLNFELKFRRH